MEHFCKRTIQNKKKPCEIIYTGIISMLLSVNGPDTLQYVRYKILVFYFILLFFLRQKTEVYIMFNNH